MRIYGGDVYGIPEGDDCRNGHQREISTHQRSVLVWLGKDLGTERMHRGFLSDQQQFNCACTFFASVSADIAPKLNIFCTV